MRKNQIENIKLIIANLRQKGFFYREEEAPEDNNENRWSWEDLHDDYEGLYEALMEIEELIK